jgi:lactate dehydrogenase-like 2-hydroxyacid dehydrogenase
VSHGLIATRPDAIARTLTYDHAQDLDAANERKITVAEVTGSNVVSVAEHVVMTILNGVRNFIPGEFLSLPVSFPLDTQQSCHTPF